MISVCVSSHPIRQLTATNIVFFGDYSKDIILLTNKLNVQLKMPADKINSATLHIINKYSSNFLPWPNKLQLEIRNISKTLIKRNILPTDPNKKQNFLNTMINWKLPI